MDDTGLPLLLAVYGFALVVAIAERVHAILQGRGLRRKGWNERWMRACERVGLSSVGPTRDGITGRAGVFGVRLAAADYVVPSLMGIQRTSGLEIAVELDRPDLGFSLRSVRLHDLGTRGGRKVGSPIGDELFDQRFDIDGSSGAALSALDAATRRLLVRQESRGGFDVGGRIASTFCEGHLDLDAVERALRDSLETAARLTRTIDVPAELAERATTDPVPGVRREALRVLARLHPDHTATRGAATAASTDPDPEIRLEAARALGADGTSIALALVDDPTSKDTAVASAITLLERRLPRSRAVEILRDARERRRFQTAFACIKRLGKGPADESLDTLVDVLKLDDGELAPAAARAIGMLGSPRAESALIAALGREDAGLRTAAAEALARLGTVASVLRLEEAAQRHAGDGQFVLNARRSIATIQSRAAGADRGQLSVADDQAGRVSLADREAGRLSAPEGEAGRLSIPRARTGG
jgi:HEAT repeat protein